eukprot:3852381-Rhodomonas_salina.1
MPRTWTLRLLRKTSRRRKLGIQVLSRCCKSPQCIVNNCERRFRSQRQQGKERILQCRSPT